MDPKMYHELDNFVRLHAHKLPAAPDAEPLVHLVPWSNKGIPLASTLVAYTTDEIKSRFNTDSPTIRWLMNQLMTYQRHESHILGFILNKDNILAHVVRRGNVRTDASAEDED